MSEHINLSHEQAVAAVYNPSTPGAVLGQIATQYRDLHPMIAQHPQVYESLLQWMTAVAATATPAAPAAATPVATPPASSSPTFTPAGMAAEPPAYTPAAANPPAYNPAAMPPPYSPATYVPSPSVVYQGADVAPAAKRGSGKRTAIVAAVSVVTLALVGTGAYAAYQKFLGPDGGIADSAQAFPASTFAMVEIAIEPSTQQKLALSSTWGKLDGVTSMLKESGASENLTRDPGTEVRPYIWDAIIEGSDIETSLDYDDDIAPWLGGRLAFGMVGAAQTPESAYIIAIECKDAEKGLAAVNTLIEEGSDGASDMVNVEERNGFIVITAAELDLDAAYADGVLADQEAFTSVVDQLGSRGLASYWIGAHSTAQAIAAWSGDAAVEADVDDALASIDKDASQAAVLRALDNGIEVQTAGAGGPELAGMGGPANAVSQLGALPDTTAMAMSVQQLGGLIDAGLTQQGAWNSLGQSFSSGALGSIGSGGYDVDDYGYSYDEEMDEMFEEARTTIEDAMGLSIPDGINEIFGDGLVFAIDQDLNCSIDSENCDSPNVALLVAADDAQKVIDSVNGWADGEVESGMESAGISSTVSDDGKLVAWGMGSYAESLVESQDDPLSGLPAFRSALPDSDKATFAMYMSGPGIVAIAKDFGAALEPDAEDAIDDFAAIGITSYVGADGVTSSRMRIIVAD